MAIKDILILLDIVKVGPAMEFALDLAAKTGARATGVALAIDPLVPGFIAGPIPIQLIEAAREEGLKTASVAIEQFEKLAAGYAVLAESRVAEVLLGGISERFIAQSRVTDLIVVGQDDSVAPEPMRTDIIEAVLFEGCAPVLVVPTIAKPVFSPKTIMVAWDGSRPAARAVHAALPILALAERIEIMMVGAATDVPGEPGADLATWLARHDLKVNIEAIHNPGIDVSNALLNIASDRGVDLLVMGAYGHSRVREFLLGGATRDILATMTVPTLMLH